jgi:UDP-4-amino-4,6-dideoxy-N-acetyl-beta-L-altrosamine transaminase
MLYDVGKVLPYGHQTIEEDDVEAVAAALRNDFLTTGPLVEEFEKACSEKTGALHTVACSSGTAALHLAALSLDLGAGDAAIVPTLTFLATANAVLMTGAEVVFADVDAATGLMTPETLSAALARSAKVGQNIKATIAVHLNGQLCAMPELAAIGREKHFRLIEDACHSLGVPNIGTTENSSLACFSTHAVKVVTTAEGGFVTMSDEKLSERIRKLRNHGMTRKPEEFKLSTTASEQTIFTPHYYEMHELGWNYRLPDILCALGISQLKKLDRFWQRRRQIAALYDNLLTPLYPALRPVPRNEQPHGYHLYALLVDFVGLGTTRGKFMAALRAEGIGTQVHYIPVHRQPYYQERYGTIDLPGADAYYARCLSIPIFPSMVDADVHKVADVLTRLVSGGPLQSAQP